MLRAPRRWAASREAKGAGVVTDSMRELAAPVQKLRFWPFAVGAVTFLFIVGAILEAAAPETRGRSLEEIQAIWASGAMPKL